MGSNVPIAQFIELKLTHQRWALDAILQACKPVKPEDFSRDLGIGPGSLQKTLGHVVDCIHIFASGLEGQPYAKPADWEARVETPPRLADELARADARLRAACNQALVRASGLNEPVQLSFMDGTPLPLATVLVEIFDHAAYHRAQCINMLKRIGVSPLPGTDPIHFHFEGQR